MANNDHCRVYKGTLGAATRLPNVEVSVVFLLTRTIMRDSASIDVQ